MVGFVCFERYGFGCNASCVIDPVITPEHFAQTLVEDYALAQNYHGVITRAIQEQLSDYKAHITSVDGDWKPPSSTKEMASTDGYKADEEDGNDADMRDTDAEEATKDCDLKLLEGDDDVAVVGQGSLDDEDVKWWESWRKRARRESAFSSSRSVASRNRRKRRKVASVKVEDSDAFETDKEWLRTTDDFEIDEKMVHEDLRILIKVRDQFIFLCVRGSAPYIWILARYHRRIYEVGRSV